MITFLFILILSINSYSITLIEHEVLSGYQQAVFIGEILNVADDTITVKPTNIMMGSIKEEIIDVPVFNYSREDTANPVKKGDYLVGTLKKDNTMFSTYTFKASSLDYKTLKLYSDEPNLIHTMATQMQGCVNSGSFLKRQVELNRQNKTFSRKLIDITLIGLVVLSFPFVVLKIKKKHSD